VEDLQVVVLDIVVHNEVAMVDSEMVHHLHHTENHVILNVEVMLVIMLIHKEVNNIVFVLNIYIIKGFLESLFYMAKRLFIDLLHSLFVEAKRHPFLVKLMAFPIYIRYMMGIGLILF